MTRDADHLLGEIVEMSHRMRQSAEAEQWDEVRQLYDQRNLQIESCFSQDSNFVDRESATTRIKVILENDRQIMELGKDAKQNLGESLGQIQQGRNAVTTYQQFSR